jgi:hypothetical protein
MPRKVFTAGEVLAAADVNSFLMDQTVMVFAGTAARGSAIGTATEGMYAHLNDTDTLTYYNGSAWVPSGGTILQVVSTPKTDVFTTTSSSFTAVTGLSATITPKSTSSKILVLAQITYGEVNAGGYGAFKVTRGGTDIYRGDASGSRSRAVFCGYTLVDSGLTTNSGSIQFLDSPASTSALTYQVEVAIAFAGFVLINRSGGDLDADNSARVRGASSITLMEVAG